MCMHRARKFKHQTLPPNATSNGGDASRVGKICSFWLCSCAVWLMG